MKEKTGIRIFAILVLSVVTILSIPWLTLYYGWIGPDKEENYTITDNFENGSANFIHPNMYLSLDEIKAIRARVDANEEP